MDEKGLEKRGERHSEGEQGKEKTEIYLYGTQHQCAMYKYLHAERKSYNMSKTEPIGEWDSPKKKPPIFEAEQGRAQPIAPLFLHSAIRY